ncbi:MAG: Gfo/Idh/MocA family protein, partial [Planctomycetota bacterium]
MARYHSRRDFLMHGGLALAGAVAIPQGAIAVNTAPRKVRIGVVGGEFGTSFQWHEHPDCVVQAVSDLRE